jgi:hypothetical protein
VPADELIDCQYDVTYVSLNVMVVSPMLGAVWLNF